MKIIHFHEEIYKKTDNFVITGRPMSADVTKTKCSGRVEAMHVKDVVASMCIKRRN